MKRETLEVIAGIIVRNGSIFIAQKPENHRVIPGKWEFPGGKIDGQKHEIALNRELDEEFDGLEVKIEKFFGRYKHSYDERTLIDLYAYICRQTNNLEVIPKEHQKIAWIKPKDLLQYDFAFIDAIIAWDIRRKGI